MGVTRHYQSRTFFLLIFGFLKQRHLVSELCKPLASATDAPGNFPTLSVALFVCRFENFAFPIVNDTTGLSPKFF